MRPADLTCRPLTEADTPAVLELLTTALAGGPTGQRSAEFFDWKHRANPFGASPGLLAQAPDGRIAAVRLFLRWQWRGGRDGRLVNALRPVDTATHPDFRGRGLFRELTLNLIEEVGGEAELLLNTPNEQSLPGYQSMGWFKMGRVPVTFRPLRPATFARGLRAALRRSTSPAVVRPCPLPSARSWLEQDSDGLAELLRERVAADRADPRLATERTEAYVRWRYGQAPGLDYRVLHLRRGGELAGVAFGRPRLRGPLTEFTLSEIIVRPGDGHTAAHLLRAAAGSGADHVATVLGRDTEAGMVASNHGYISPPVRSGIVVAARRTDGAELRHRLNHWRFTLGDLEVF
ncbi:hypothetical protein GCM10009665_77540 [Kitasatospora nipponensis]|uniref:N-acetyltransferase domain-containing protein n=1 Tax=Kitasatospora nipponensis TaxID=258049 RepID=A0ABP4DSC9_9ACTN